MAHTYSTTFTAGPEHIDELGHVNNGVWVQWMEAVATAHWTRDADPAHVAAFAWVVTRHEIDYRGNVGLGDVVSAETEIREPPQGPGLTGTSCFATPPARPLSPPGPPGPWLTGKRAACCACRPKWPRRSCQPRYPA